MPAPTRIILIGFMGSGKTTIGRALAERLGRTFADLDEAIAARAQRSIPDIFATAGEQAFRSLETAALTAALQQSNIVLALGGGAIETPANRALLAAAPDTTILYLTAPFNELAARCRKQAADPAATARPLFADPAAAAARLQLRDPMYAALAHSTVSTANATPADTVARIMHLFNH